MATKKKKPCAECDDLRAASIAMKRALEKLADMAKKEDDSSLEDAVWSACLRPVIRRGLAAYRKYERRHA